MRPHRERGVAEQRHAAEHDLRRVHDRRSAGRTAAGRARKSHATCGATSSRACCLGPGDDVGPDQRRRDRWCRGSCRSRRCRSRRAAPAWSAGTRRCCRRACRARSRCCGRAPGRRGTVRPAAGNRCSRSKICGVDRRRNVALVEHGAPGDVAGIDRLRVRQELLAHGRAAAVGADQQIAALARAVGEDRGDAVGVLLDARQRHAEAVAVRRAPGRAASGTRGPTSSSRRTVSRSS